MTWKRNNTGSSRSIEGAPNRSTRQDSNRNENDSPASRYIRDNYKTEDRLAAVVINKRTGSTIQRIAPAESIAAEDGQRWLRYMNDSDYEVYLSANALKEEARSRTKEDVGAIRHIYLDIDQDGDKALERLLARSDLPQPNYVLSTSPGKYQVIWKAEGFNLEQAEDLQRRLSRDTGADIAVTDSARILRLPGFYNRKYDPPHLVEAREISRQIHTPENFAKVPEVERQPGMDVSERSSLSTPSQMPMRRISQSERDWAYARRALSRGDNPDTIVAAIASYRRYDKHNPRQYAERTVEKASQSLAKQEPRTETQIPSYER